MRETTSSCNLLAIFWIEKCFVMTLLLFIHFFKASIWKLHALLMYSIHGIEESNNIQENLCYSIWYSKRKNCVVKNLFIVCVYCKRNGHNRKLFNTSLLYPPFFTLIYLMRFHSVSLFNGFIPLVRICGIT